MGWVSVRAGGHVYNGQEGALASCATRKPRRGLPKASWHPRTRTRAT